jgi:shikimate kinase
VNLIIMKTANNISLIGMPGAGKSTSGRLLAMLLDMHFIDIDELIRQQKKRSLQDIVDSEGPLSLRKLEEQAILSLALENTVIATGGSAVYSAAAMQHLSALSHVVYLQAPYEVIAERIRDLDTRGLARQPQQSLLDLYNERVILYERYAEITIDATLAADTVAKNIASEVSRLMAAGK